MQPVPFTSSDEMMSSWSAPGQQAGQQPTAPMDSKGQSQKLLNSKNNLKNIFEEFRMHEGNLKLYPMEFESLPEATLTSQNLYARFASYLLEVYEKDGEGGKLDYKVCLCGWCGCIYVLSNHTWNKIVV